MKNIKIVSALCALAILGVGLVSCGGETNNDGTNTDGTSTQQVFEAEYVDCSEIENAPGWSGGGGGTDIIAVDQNNLGASNGFYVTYLYGEGITLEFNLTSDKAVSDVTLHARLSAEGGSDFTISSENYTIAVNGTALTYSPIRFSNVPALPNALAFQDYIIGTNISLNEGENVITLTTSNDDSLGGTTEATAPMVDCIKLTTTATVTMEEHQDNLDNF